LLNKGVMTKKLLIARLGAGSITVALCAALPGCNLMIRPVGCTQATTSRGTTLTDCPDGEASDTGTPPDGAGDAPGDAASGDATAADASGDRSAGSKL
jgi:hypothetical protein